MAPAWRFPENTEILVLQGIIDVVKHSRSELWLVHIQYFLVAMPLQSSEVLFSQVDNLLVINASRGTNYHVFTVIHSLVVLDNHLPCDFIDVFNLAEDRKTHFMVSPDIEIDLLHKSLIIIIISRKKLLPNGRLFTLNVECFILGIG